MTPIPKTFASHQKGVKMKSTQIQLKKKITMTKALNDSISDTISSVIHGKIANRKAESKPTSPKKLIKNDKPKVIKKMNVSTKKAVVATSSASCILPKNDNANLTRANNAKAELQSGLKKQQEKSLKAATSAVKQLKSNVSADVKSQIKPTNVVKRQNSPAKVVNNVTDKDKATTNVSKDTTKERVANKTDVPDTKDKLAPLKKKMLVVNKAVKIKMKIVTAKNVKQKLISKPKKVVQTAIKAGAKKNILITKSAALSKKIIRKITPKRILHLKENITNSSKSSLSNNTSINGNSSEKNNTAINSLLREEQIKKEPLDNSGSNKLVNVKEENDSDSEKKSAKAKSLSKVKSKTNSMMIKRLLSNHSVKAAKQSKKMKLYNMWNGPKRHRVASLNALAKVHCLYENETRGILLDQMIYGVKKENIGKIKSEDEAPSRQLRNNPGSRGVGKHWEMHDESSSSSSCPTSEDEEDEYEFKETNEKPCLRKIRRVREPPKVKEKVVKDESSDDSEPVAAPVKVKRPRKPKKKSESPIMDLKDLIVPKRMASLNASAILAASYSVEKRSNRPPNSDSEDSTDSGDSYFKEPIPEDVQLEQIVKMEQQQAADDQNKLIDVCTTPGSKKVAVILNQDTDVTITGMYVNSTRSTHHEGFCSIAGMQYRISATSHTQTAATAVTSETILQTAEHQNNTNGDSVATTAPPVHPNKSYTPLGALSSMQPPSTSTTSSSTNNNNNNPFPSGQLPLPTTTTQHTNSHIQPPPHHVHSHHHHRQPQHISSSPPGGVGPPLHPQQQPQYHHHHHHVGAPPPPPGHYHHPHQLVVTQYPPPPHQYYPHPHVGAIKGRYGLYHHHGGGGHHHASSAAGVIDRSPSDNSAFSAPPQGVGTFPVNSTSAGAASTINSSSSVVATGVGQPPLTMSQSSAGSGSESEGIGSGYVRGYYQPAGPLISLSHGHSQLAPLVKTQPVDPPTSISPLPLHKIQPPSSTGDSSDNEVIITSVTTIKDNSSSITPSSRLSPTTALTHPLSSLPPPPPSSYRSPYHASQPYAPPPPPPPTAYTTYPTSYGSPYHSPYYSPYPPPNHHELCYPAPGGGYVTTTAHHKYPPPTQSAVQANFAYRKFLSSATAAGGYYVTTAPEMFGGQGPGPGPGGGNETRAVTGSSGASSNGSGSYQTVSPRQSTPQSVSSSSSQLGQGQQPHGQPPTIIETYTPPPPQPALLDSYPPPPPPSHYYPGYGPAAPPSTCYGHPHPHSPSRGMPFLNATYPPCPCPMQSCPKNVHTGPLTGDCKRSTALQIAKATTLPPVALALPLEPASATGPPSPARGSAGMPPPPSPAGATYHNIPPLNTSDTHTMAEMLPLFKNEQISDSESTQSNSTTQASDAIEEQQRPGEVAVDLKPTEEKRRKARVGKAMVRNSIQQLQQMNNIVNNGNNGNTMLLMCHPALVGDQTLGVDVKREVESPVEILHHLQGVQIADKEKRCVSIEEMIVAEDLTIAKEPSVLPNGQIQINQTNVKAFPVQIDPVVIQDVKTEKISEPPHVAEMAKTQPVITPIEILEPCQKTVAENVKVKNMKRKLSFNNNNNNNVEEKKIIRESLTPAKQSKQTTQVNINNNNNNNPNNGSYKDLIKKGCSTFKINNGRRKLIISNGGKLQSKLVPSKFPKKRTPVKRKAIVPLKDETNSKRVKLNPKPLGTNNSKGSIHLASRNNHVKENTFIDTSLIERKAKNGRKNVNQSEIIKTNVDRTIESVVNHHVNSSVIRIENSPTRSRSRSNETFKESKEEATVLLNTNTISTKRSAAVKASKMTKVSEVVSTPSIISVSNVVLIPSVQSFLKPSVIPKAIASTSKAVAGTSKDLCCVVPTMSKAGTSKQSVVRKRKMGVQLSAARSVASGTRSLKASAALAASVVITATVARSGRRSVQQPRWSNGWMWEGEPFQREVFLNSDDAVVFRKCYPAMRHREGDTIEPRDCVLLKAGPRKNDLPFVAKVAALWENPEDGEMMMSLLWYYRPEHTDQGRTCVDQPDEVFASRHKDSNSVACIEDKCYVLTFNEYCRYRKNLKRLEEGLADTSPCIPLSEPYLRDCRQPPKSVPTSPEMIFFCRRVYDFRQKRIIKNPS